MYHTVNIEYAGIIPIVKFELGSRECIGIIDTGSEITFFNKELQPSEDTKDNVSLSTVSSKNQIQTVQVKCNIDFCANENTFSCKAIGYSVDLGEPSAHFQNQFGFKHNIDAIFGVDFLKKYQCKIDFKNGYLLIQDKTK